MEKLIYFNTITIWLIVAVVFIRQRFQKLSFEISRTFWEKKPYGFIIYKWKKRFGEYPNNGKSILRFNWRNPDNMSDDISKATK